MSVSSEFQGDSAKQVSCADPLDHRLEQPFRDMNAHSILSKDLHAALDSARPHLLRSVRLQGIPSDVTEDVVQETLLEAWRSLAHLRDPQHFGAWLDGICRNICLRHLRAQRRAHGEIPLSLYEEQTLEAVADPRLFDPADLLDRYDLEHLLDLALAHLSAEARQVVSLYYLADLPQQEIAQRLRLTLRTLEKRLQRARQQLRWIFSSTLRAEVEACGIDIAAHEHVLWRDTHMWCVFCGRRRLRGQIVTQAGGKSDFRLRCETCSLRFGGDILTISNLALPPTFRAFRPLYKRIISQEKAYFVQAFATGNPICRNCGDVAVARITQPNEWDDPLPESIWATVSCPRCQTKAISSVTSAVCFGEPLARSIVDQFMALHPHCIVEPAQPVDYQGQVAIRLRLITTGSSRRLTLIVHAQTLQILTIIHE